MSFRHLLPLVLIASAAVSSFAGGGKAVKDVIIQDPLTKGTTEVELLGGYFHSPVVEGGGHRPQFDYSGADIRLGIVLTPVIFDHSFLRGNLEFLGDVLGDGVVKGSGNYLVGGSLLFRYNFIQPGTRFVPYIQLGGGGLHSDAVQDHTQRLIGGDFEFILEADLGARFILTDRWSFLLEGGFQHISNADTASRNVGVNALGGRIGLGYIY